MLSRFAECESGYPLSTRQNQSTEEKLFCTLGGNIETVAIDGDSMPVRRW